MPPGQGSALRRWSVLRARPAFTGLHGASHRCKGRNVSTRAASTLEPVRSGQPHQPVLLTSVVQAFSSSSLATLVDGTIGAGGHSAALAAAHTELKHLVGIDADPAAFKLATNALSAACSQGIVLSLVQGNFSKLCQILQHHSVPKADGILLDIGVSSMQLDTADRGFSFSRPGPLDMRMGPSAAASAADLVNTLPEDDLGRIFREYGEERQWRRLARNLCEARAQATVQSTDQLITALRLPPRPRAVRGKGQKSIHPATRVFQVSATALKSYSLCAGQKLS